MGRRRLIATTAAAALAATVAATPASPRLIYAALVMRHGVRAPTWDADRLNRYSSAVWPDFGVPLGYLTPRGAALLRRLADYDHDRFVEGGLLPASGCTAASHVYIWADTDQRTLESGRVFGEALQIGCTVSVHSRAAADGKDPLFDPIAAGLFRADTDAQVAAVRARIGDAAQFLGRLRPAFKTLHEILNGTGAAAEQPFADAPVVDVEVKDGGVEIQGPLAAASTLSENLLLEYANGFSGRELGWERLDAAKLRRVLELHTAYAELARRTPAIARTRSSLLLSTIARSLDQAAAGAPVSGALGPSDTALLVIVGHDTNQSNLSGMLGLTWSIDGYPDDDTPPGGALLFELWRDPASKSGSVRVKYLAQTPDQMHDDTTLSLARPPAVATLTIEGCPARSDCPYATFAAAVKNAIDLRFVR